MLELKNNQCDCPYCIGDEELPIPYTNAKSVACIVHKTPISIRKHKKDGLVASIAIDSHYGLTYLSIKYCPICGRDLSK